MPDFSSLLTSQFFTDNPTAGFYNIFPQAYRANPFGEFLRGSQSRTYNKYLSELPNSPNRSFQDFLRGLNLSQEFSNMTPGQRGERPGFYSPPVRFINKRY